MSYREKRETQLSPIPVAMGVRVADPIPAKRVFAEGLCDICTKPMHEHGPKDCRGVEIILIDESDAKKRAKP